MRHAKKRGQLNRFTSWHKATLKSLVKNLLISKSIVTTVDRAKASRGLAEKLVTLAKKNDLASRRRAQKVLGEHKIVSMLFNEIGPLFAKKSSGFTRIINLGKRRGDNAEMVIFELTEKKPEIRKQKTEGGKEKAKNKPVVDLQAENVKDDSGVKELQDNVQEKAEEKAAVEEKPQVKQAKPQKKFLGGLKGIFRKERGRG